MQYLHSASSIVVLDGGRVQYQGTLAEITAQGYVPPDAIGGCKAKQEDQKAAAADYVAEKEEVEAPIAAGSLGWTPYKFFLGLAGAKNVVLCAVNETDVVLMVALTDSGCPGSFARQRGYFCRIDRTS